MAIPWISEISNCLIRSGEFKIVPPLCLVNWAYTSTQKAHLWIFCYPEMRRTIFSICQAFFCILLKFFWYNFWPCIHQGTTTIIRLSGVAEWKVRIRCSGEWTAEETMLSRRLLRTMSSEIKEDIYSADILGRHLNVLVK